MSELADYFGKLDADSDDDKWLRAAVSNPAAWRDPENPITERVMLTLCQDQSISPQNMGPARKTLRAIAVELLISANGDEDRVRYALDKCRVSNNWLNLNPWQQKAAILVQLAKKPMPRTEEEWLHVSESPKKDYLKGYPVCPLCHAIPCECDD